MFRRLSLVLAVVLLSSAGAVSGGLPTAFDFEIAECGTIVEGVFGDVVRIEGFLTVENAAAVSAWSFSLQFRSPDGLDFCIPVAPYETCGGTCHSQAANSPSDLGLPDPFDFTVTTVVQDISSGCDAGSGDPSTAQNAGRVGVIDGVVMSLTDPDALLPPGTVRILPFAVDVTVGPTVRTLVLEYVTGASALEGTGSPVDSIVVIEGAQVPADLGRCQIAFGLPFDVDDDGEIGGLTDGLLILRYIFGFRGTTLVAGAVDLANCGRCTADAIEAYLAAQGLP